MIQARDAESLYDLDIEPDLNRFMGRIFENMCCEYIAMLNSRKDSRIPQYAPLPFKIRQIGRWWGANPKTKSEEEIDIMGVNEKLSSVVFCECKYRNEPTDIQVLNTLVNKAERWNYDHKYFIIFSKSGFTKGLKNAAKKAGNVQLIILKEMYA